MKQDSIIEMVKDFKYQMNSYEKIYPSTKKWLNPFPLLSAVIDQTRLLENNADSSGALLSKKLSNAKE
jgi:hypothetical protein